MNHAAETNPRHLSPRSVPVLEVADPWTLLAALPVTEEEPRNALPVPPRRNFFLRCVFAVASALEWLFGFVSLFIALAVLAALPVLQLLSLGYLLEAGGRVARSGKLRDGFIGVRLAARLGGVVAASWLLLLPARFVADMARAAEIIDPGGRAAGAWRIVLVVLIVLTFVHVAAACARGGRLRYFVWPFNLIWLIRRFLRGGYYAEARDAVWDTVAALRLPYYFWLGFRGFVGAFAWLALPITLLALGRAHFRAAPLIGVVGALLLAWVLMYLPFLQMRLAAANRLRAVFDLRAARALHTGALGLRLRVLHHAAVRPAALPLEDPDGAPRRRLDGEPLFHRLHLPRTSADGLGAGPVRPPCDAAPLVLSLDRPSAFSSRGAVVRADRVLHAVHQLERRLEPLRTTRLPCAGAVLRPVTPNPRTRPRITVGRSRPLAALRIAVAVV